MKNSSPKVTILMAAYNSERYVKECMDSMLNQTFKDFEFILFDDGSTDNTYKLLKEYAQKDSRITLYRNKENHGYAGVVETLNRGIDMAKGEYIARMDIDDVSHLDRIEKEVDYLGKHKDIFLVSTGAENITENGVHMSNYIPSLTPDEVRETLSKNNCVYNPTTMFRNNSDLRYRLVHAEDYDFFLQIIKAGLSIAIIPEILLRYRITKSSLSRTSAIRSILFTYFAQQLYTDSMEYKDIDIQKYIKDINLEELDINILEEMLKIAMRSRNYFAVNEIWKAMKSLGSRSLLKRIQHGVFILKKKLSEFKGSLRNR